VYSYSFFITFDTGGYFKTWAPGSRACLSKNCSISSTMKHTGEDSAGAKELAWAAFAAHIDQQVMTEEHSK